MANLIICCGVSGCGKSTLAQQIAQQYGYSLLEADDYHCAENVSHMKAGKPLTDAMRTPWVQAITQRLQTLKQQNQHCVMANSCLRRAHRQGYRELGFNTVFVYLDGDHTLISARLAQRVNHFMPASLLQSQLAAFEPFVNESDVVKVDLALSIHQQLSQVSDYLASRFK